MSWVPVDIRATSYLPRDRRYTELEALYALQVDYYRTAPATVAGYAAQWRWSRDRVRSWLASVGLAIVGQTGQKPGRLMPKAPIGQQPVSNLPAVCHLMFYDPGMLSSFARQKQARNQSGTCRKPDTPNIDNTNNTITDQWGDMKRTQRLLNSNFSDDDHIPVGADLQKLWVAWDKTQAKAIIPQEENYEQ